MKLSDLVKLKPIIEAVENGKTIQVRHSINNVTVWVDLSGGAVFSYDDFNDTFASDLCNLRIKPEPREWYEIVAKLDDIPNDRFQTLEAAKAHIFKCGGNLELYSVIKMREVIE